MTRSAEVELARAIRRDIVAMSHRGRASHLGSSLSCVELLVAATQRLWFDPACPDDPDRDRLILSKGHAAAALYATLAHRRFFPRSRLQSFNQVDGALPEQPSPGCAPGVEWATGSLGHGLSVGVGFALASRIRRRSTRVIVIASDGELNEGSVWEAAMLAAARQLEQLTLLVDANGWQATDRTSDVLALEPLVSKWRAFGWDACEVDGHDLDELSAALGRAETTQGPSVIIGRTVKGRGVSFMEDDNNWHYRIPDEAELAAAGVELGSTEEESAVR